MEQFDGQLVLTLTCVLLSAAVLIRRFVQFVRHPSGSGCHSGGCSGCPAKNAANADGFISLDQFSQQDLK